MAKKSITMRLDDRTIELIEAQAGENLTQKFENLVTRCTWELPEKEKQIKQYRDKIKREQNQLSKLSQQVFQYQQIVQQLDQKLGVLVKQIEASVKERSA